jgi:molybdenum cofactor cytidylyltransferase
MGRPKALLPFSSTTFIGKALAVFDQLGIEEYRVVLGRDAELIRMEAAIATQKIVLNPDPSRGQLSSLKLALEDTSTAEYDAAVVWLVDHPGIESHTVKTMLEAFRDDFDFLRPEYGDRHGHPLIINSRMFAIIKEMPLDRGLKPLFSSGEYRVFNLPVDDGTVLQDIDTPEDFKKSIEDE